MSVKHLRCAHRAELCHFTNCKQTNTINMNNEEKRKLLQDYYFNEKKPAAYAGAKKMFDVLNKKYPGLFTLSYIKQWFSDQDAYSLQKSRRYKFKTANVRVTDIGEQLDVELLSMTNLATENDVRFLAPLAEGQRAIVMALCPSCVRPFVRP